MRGPELDEHAFFASLAGSGARVLLIGRRAMVALGIPVLTADYDLWAHIDDIEKLNAAMTPHDLIPSHPADEARLRGRYVLENDEHVDVLVARRQTTKSGDIVAFDEVWQRRVLLAFTDDVMIAVPSIDDLIRTKMWSMRAKDVTDIQLLEVKKREGAT